jgi:arylsulfatase A-like enzyme
VPFAAQWKGTLPAGIDFDHPVISLDIMATIVALCGATISADYPLDGVNLIPHLTGVNPSPPHTLLFWRKYQDMSRAVRFGDFKLVDTDPATEDMELYNLTEDIGERNFLTKRLYQPGIQRSSNDDESYPILEMIKEWERWSKGLKPLAFPTLGEDVWW